MEENGTSNLLLFSGGRDSTIAAVRLASENKKLLLATVTSDHLYGLFSVEKRLQELARILPESTEWVNVIQPKNLLTETSFYAPTCLPCHHAYVGVGAHLATSEGYESIGFGYVRYQNGWPEQTPEATARLGLLLEEMGLTLKLPVYELESKEQALTELRKNQLSTLSLEQKCSRQVNNIALPKDLLNQELDRWEGAIRATLKHISQLPVQIKRRAFISEFK